MAGYTAVMIYELGVIGAGNMAEAIVRGVLKAGPLKPDQIIAADTDAGRRELFESQLGVKTIEAGTAVAGAARVVLLSVKPQQAASLISTIGQLLDPHSLVISIMAGISTQFIERQLGGGKPWRIVRTMPNTPMLVGEGMVGIAPGQFATPADLALTRRMFESSAAVIEVTESQLDAVTAVSGSGPAYFFYFVEHLMHAGQSLGLSAEQSRLLAVKTATGAARMLSDTADSAQVLRKKVTSPGGTTQAAITHLENNHVGETFAEAVRAAANRSRELGV